MSLDYLDHILLHITAKCNYACSHCYVDGFRSLGSIEDEIEAVSSVLGGLEKPVHLTGG